MGLSQGHERRSPCPPSRLSRFPGPPSGEPYRLLHAGPLPIRYRRKVRGARKGGGHLVGSDGQPQPQCLSVRHRAFPSPEAVPGRLPVRLRTVRSKVFLGMGSVILCSTLLSLCIMGRLVGRFAEVEVAQNLRQARQAFEEFILVRKKLLRDKARSLSQTPYL